MKIQDFQTRVGAVNYAYSYDSRGVKRLAKGPIRLSVVRCKDLAEGYCSAGLLGPQEALGTYTIMVRGRLDSLDPNVVFAIWFYNDANANELDLLETTRWGDVNSPDLYYCTEFRAGVKKNQVKFAGRAFDLHKIVCTLTDKSFSIRIFGVRPNGEEKEVAFFSGGRGDVPTFGQLRMALWVPKQTGFTYSRIGARGKMEVTVESVDFVPSTTIVQQAPL